ncbi:MAG: hypothetical protein C0621_01185 [Desulfuromonas sp.]|nr:MAG: hypothetical protein C0621_01185 [Desulfuromonas sp.]
MPRLHEKTVVVCGGEGSALKDVAILLRRLGYRVFPAEGSGAVLERLTKQAVDLVLLDSRLPAADVIATLKAMRQSTAWEAIPVLTVAADYSKTGNDEYIRFGSAGLLEMPSRAEALSRLIEQCIAPPGRPVRTAPRVPYSGLVKLSWDGGSEIYRAVNLSTRGIYLRSAEPLPVTTRVELEFVLDGDETLRFGGEVIYQMGSYNDVFRVDPGMAIAFDQLDDEPRQLLEDWVEEVLCGDLDSMRSRNLLRISHPAKGREQGAGTLPPEKG